MSAISLTRNGPRSGNNNAAGRGNYEYFQLYEPDDSDIDEEVDPDVRDLLAAAQARRDASANRKRICKKFTSGRFALLLLSACACVVVLLVVISAVQSAHSSASTSSASLPTSASPVGPSPSASAAANVNDDNVKSAKLSALRSLAGDFAKAAVAIDGKPCAKVGTDVLARNGTAVDAAIAALFCNGVYTPQSMGLGGGFVMTVYVRAERKAYFVNARETAPAAANHTMFHGDPMASRVGALSAAVPGEVRGYMAAKARFGNPSVSWASLVQPAIDMARNGITVSKSAADAMRLNIEDIKKDEGLRQTFINPLTGDTWRTDDVYTRKNLAETLQRIADSNGTDFYEGQIAKSLVKDIKEHNGIITEEDLKEYRAVISDALSLQVGDSVVYGPGAPASGAVLISIFNVLQHFHMDGKDLDTPIAGMKIVEAFKWAYAARSRLGDPADKDIADEVKQLEANLTSAAWGWSVHNRINDSWTSNDPAFYGGDFAMVVDSGTAHASVVAPNGDAVSVTSTVNMRFGSKFLCSHTGVLLNNEMDDFSFSNVTNDYDLPPSPHNYLRPGKRPQSSMAPVVVANAAGDVTLVVGAAGGAHIPSSTAYVMFRHLWLKEDVCLAVDAPRLHHQLLPMRAQCEEGTPKNVLSYLESHGHKVQTVATGDSIVQAVARSGDGTGFRACSDYRKSGGVHGF